ncbi:MAG: UDP-N-acetylmuramoyl-L-alanyl-D-glutamate--2,6-diaminopimelate ligase [Simkania sp.]|nr:UDP-N-acetylmuramoyl-L-alanyl-D-glutamate--2,6-diaminopimelate ligase [Simkania sp.]
MLKLRKLLSRLPDVIIRGSKEIEITGISANSKTIAPGNLFIAKKGMTVDGALYISEAVNAGATAVLTDLYNPFLPSSVTQLIHPNILDIESEIAAQYFECPSKELFLIGVTGTNGKTTTTFLIRHLLGSSMHPCGLIGTVEWALGHKIQPATQTTPDVITNHRLLKEMLHGGCKTAVMEVSSHALDQGRVKGLDFNTAIFTNLTQDHLDYHGTMEHYAASKARLFTSLSASSLAILNMDDPAWEIMKEHSCARIITYGITSKAQLRAEDIVLSVSGTRFTLCYQGEKHPFFSPLIGTYNIYNILAAVAAALSYGLSIEDVQSTLSTFTKVPGRLEKIYNSKGFSIFVDYAHTDDALENVLKTLNELKKGRLILVFGCGGDRDRGKRPKMGKVATALADLTMITSDNPRNEDPSAIIEEIKSGCNDSSRYIVEVDRKLAIERAILLAQPEDILLIAGKGHERYQILGSRQVLFDDREVAYQAACSLI